MAVVAVTLLIGFTGIAGLFGLPVMPISYLGWMVGLMIVYMILAQIMMKVYARLTRS